MRVLVNGFHAQLLSRFFRESKVGAVWLKLSKAGIVASMQEVLKFALVQAHDFWYLIILHEKNFLDECEL